MTKKGAMDWWVSVPGARRVRALTKRDFFNLVVPGWHVANEIAKPQVCIDSNNSSVDCKKTATGNGNLQPEIEINEYSRQP